MAGVLVLLIAITLIILKLGFLLLLVAGPFFLIVGTHPGFGRVVALRWVEMLVGVLLKQAAVALVLSVLLYAYSLIMGTSDAALPWALKILMIALVTVAVFIYRKPFVHLFSAVGYGMVGSRDRAEAGLAQAGSLARRNTVDAATVGVPGFAAYRAARWARRNPAQAAGLAAGAAAGGAGAAAAGASAASAATVGSETAAPDQAGAPGDVSADEAQGGSGRSGLASRGRARAAAARCRRKPARRTTAGPAGPGRHRPAADAIGLGPLRSSRRRGRPGSSRAGPACGYPRSGRVVRSASPGSRAPGTRAPRARRLRLPRRRVRPGPPGSGPAALAGRRTAPPGRPPAVWGQRRPAAGAAPPTFGPPRRGWCPIPQRWPPRSSSPARSAPPGAATRGAHTAQ